jgi:hypothetical protein
MQKSFENYEVIEGDSKIILGQWFFEKYFPSGVDFAFVDGDHTYEGCLNDLNAVYPYLSETGIVVVDDYRSGPPNGAKFSSVTRAVEEFALEHRLSIRYWHKHGKGVAIIRKSASQWDRAKTLFRVLPLLPIRKARAFVGRTKSRLKTMRMDGDTLDFIGHNRRVWKTYKNDKPKSIVLYSYHNIAQTLIAASYFMNVLAKKHNAQIKAFSSKRRSYPLSLYYRRNDAVYRSFNTAEFISVSLNRRQKALVKKHRRDIDGKMRTKKDLLDLHVLGVWIGIDIYETYLRRFNRPTADLNDPRLGDIIDEAIGCLVYWKGYLEDNNVAAIALDHDVYIDQNILAKLAYNKNIPVYLPNVRGLWRVDRPFSVCSYFSDYRKMFNELSVDEKKKAVSIAKRQLEKRLSGEVGVDMPYSFTSAYHKRVLNDPVLRKSDRLKVLICSHCFFDNPHAYARLPFVDFYEWLNYLGRISERTNYDWYIKMHRDALPGTEETIRDIIRHYKNITFIAPDVSFHQLAEEGVNFVLTIYGSVGHECPALGMQVLNAGYNPHIAYDFNWHARSLEEYEHYLLNLDKLQKTINNDDMYEFYYMHYYYTLADDLVFKSYRRCINDLTVEEQCRSVQYNYFLDQLTEEKHNKIIANMRKFIDCGKRYYFSRGPE